MKAIENPPNPFASHDCEYLDGMVPPAKLEIYEDATRTILSKNDSPDLAFRWSINPYRGCAHACVYCYARPSHEYLGFGAGSDFDTKILVKKNSPELLRQAFMKPSWKGEMIMFSGDTDAYQPLEASFQITRRLLEVCLEFGNPVGMITKSSLILRDLELLKKLHARTRLWAVISIPFIEEKTARLIEPHAASIERRFEMLRILSEAGIHTGVNIAPVIPGLNDSDIAKILKRARECGAQSAGFVMLRLPGSVKEVFSAGIRKLFPLAHEKVMRRIREARGGKLYDSRFGERFRGTGVYWENVEKLFESCSTRLGFNQKIGIPEREPFKRPENPAANRSPQKDFLFY